MTGQPQPSPPTSTFVGSDSLVPEGMGEKNGQEGTPAAPHVQPEAAETEVSGQPAEPPKSPNRWLIGTDLEQARKRIRYGGVAGLAAAGINFVVAVITYFGDEGVAGVIRPGGGAFVFVLVEAGLMTALSVGVLRRNRSAAVMLLGYHVVSKLILFGLAAFGVGPGSLRAIPFHLVFAYLFIQSLRGALTWHYLTHPFHPSGPTGIDSTPEHEETLE